MKVKKTKIKDLLIIEPRIYNDSRGFFFESYNQKIYDKSGIESKFVHDHNHLTSTQGKATKFVNNKYDLKHDVARDQHHHQILHRVCLSLGNQKYCC